jgi:putative ABC transport system permease protein
VVAANSDAARVTGIIVAEGRFLSDFDVASGSRVCVIGANAAAAMKPQPRIGDLIRIDDQYFRVIGIVAAQGIPVSDSDGGPAPSGHETRSMFAAPASPIQPRRVSEEIYVPLHPAIVHPAAVPSLVKAGLKEMIEKELGLVSKTLIPEPPGKLSVDQCVALFESDDDVLSGAQMLNTSLSRIKGTSAAHKISAPLDILAQVERTRRLFNLVLGAIAAISLLVGGIGIMNILTASVAERTREIGVRRATGARRSDIAMQFLSEAVLISLFGTITGILAGLAAAWVIEHGGGIPTAFSIPSVVYSAVLALGCGVVFGLAPAIHASRISPAEALRSV